MHAFAEILQWVVIACLVGNAVATVSAVRNHSDNLKKVAKKVGFIVRDKP